MKQALFHCNAGVDTGMGHFMRCLALAEEALRRGWRAAFAGSLGEAAQAVLAELIPDAELHLLPSPTSVRELSSLVDGMRPDVVHVDSYETRLEGWLPRGPLMSNAQDGRFGQRSADLHIDANLFAEERWDTGNDGSALVGAAAMQIRDQARRIDHRVRESLIPPLRILLVLGGTDPQGLTPRLAASLANADPPIELTVICRGEMHEAVLAGCGSTASQLTLLSFAKDLPGLADEQDLVITAAGTSIWDFAAGGVPMAIACVADNQIESYRSSIRAGIAIPLGMVPGDDLDSAIGAAIFRSTDRSRLATIAHRARILVDGLGAWRIIAAWEQLLESRPDRRTSATADPLTARPARSEDADTLFRWRNDPTTRSASRNGGEIDWSSHVAWLERVIASPDRQLLIAERDGRAVGTARWDRLDASAWEVSITVAPELRGQGLAGSVLRTAETRLDAPDPALLVATIHDDNLPSRSLFARAGYLPHQPSNELGFGSYAKWRFAAR